MMKRREFLGCLSAAAAGSFASATLPLGHSSAAEPAAEPPTVRVVDTHTHFYDPTRPQGVPWPDKDTWLYRPVYPTDWLAVAAPLGIRETVVVEASEWVEDNQWVLDLAKDNPCIIGLVGNLSPHHVDFEKHLKRFAKNPIFRGIRVREGLPMLLDDADFHRGIKRLVDHDLQLDLNGPPEILSPVAKFASDFPSLRIVIDHVGGAGDPQRLTDQWRQGMSELGKCDNVFCKVSALGEQTDASTERFGTSPREVAFYQPILDHCWDVFGEDRLIYGSNWPVCEKGGSYADQFDIVHAYFTAKGPEALEKYFWKNAHRAYRWAE